MKTLKSTNGYKIILDNDDYEKFKNYKYWTDKRGYSKRYAKINGKSTCLIIHREILNAPKDSLVDHKNGNTLDNRKLNLRLCSSSENCFNRKKYPSKIKKFTSKFLGVSYQPNQSKRNPWKSYITLDKKTIHLGNYPKEEYAAVAYNAVTRLLAKKFFKGNIL